MEGIASTFLGDSQDSGYFWLYEAPEDFREDIWPRTALASNFRASAEDYSTKMAPGKARQFWPSE